MNHLNAFAFGGSAAIVALVGMMLLGLLGNFGVYMGAVEMMEAWHMFFSLTLGGIIAGMIEGAVMSFFLFWIFAWLYNQLVANSESKR